MNNGPYNPPTDPVALFHAPSWANDWCPYCGWGATCANCRAGWQF